MADVLHRGDSQVRLFTRAMLRELQANAYKGDDWDNWSRRKHFYELDYHLAKLKAAIREDDTVRILEFAADLSNHAMFAADAALALTRETLQKRRAEASFVKPNIRVYVRLLRNPRWARKAWGGFRHPVDREQHHEPRLPGGTYA